MAQSLTLNYSLDNWGRSERINAAPIHNARDENPRVILLSEALTQDSVIKLSQRSVYRMSLEEHDVIFNSVKKSVKVRKILRR
jgi:hypothetical protein